MVENMKDGLLRYTFRTNPELLSKLRYIAGYNGRSANKELERLVMKHIVQFEKMHGKISLVNVTFQNSFSDY